MRRHYSLIGCILFCWACNNIEDASPAKRKTFVRFYEAAHDLTGVSAEPVENGYVILGNEKDNKQSIFIQTDHTGERIAPDIIFHGGYSNGLKVAADGYYIIGDSIKSSQESGEGSVFDLIVSSARLFKLDKNGNVVRKVVITDRKETTNITDFHGGAMTFNSITNELVVLGTFKKGSSTERPYLIAFNPTTFDTLWTKNYDVIDRDYVNSKSVHITPTGRILWASALLRENQNFSRSYIGIPYIKENSTFENFSEFGALTDQQLFVNDIQPAESSAFGYGIIGTYASPAGVDDANMFFLRVNQYGSIIEGSERYFDGERSADNKSVSADESERDDTGDAITSTQDGGFVLAGSMESTPNRGNGGTDIFLVKVDGQGNVLWNRVLGGKGNETVSSIRETDDGGLLICGSNDASDLSSIFIMKTDRNGELKD